MAGARSRRITPSREREAIMAWGMRQLVPPPTGASARNERRLAKKAAKKSRKGEAT